MQGGKNWIVPKEINATGSSETLIGWKFGKTTMSLYGTEWRERGYGLRAPRSIERSVLLLRCLTNQYIFREISLKLNVKFIFFKSIFVLPQGSLLPSSVSDLNADWKCAQCAGTMPVNKVSR